MVDGNKRSIEFPAGNGSTDFLNVDFNVEMGNDGCPFDGS
jgi:hypothetical protein